MHDQTCLNRLKDDFTRLTPNDTGQSEKFIFERFPRRPFSVLSVINFDDVEWLLIGRNAADDDEFLSDSGDARRCTLRWHVGEDFPLFLGAEVDLKTIERMTLKCKETCISEYVRCKNSLYTNSV